MSEGENEKVFLNNFTVKVWKDTLFKNIFTMRSVT